MFTIAELFQDLDLSEVHEINYDNPEIENTYRLEFDNMSHEHVLGVAVEVSKEFAQKWDLVDAKGKIIWKYQRTN